MCFNKTLFTKTGISKLGEAVLLVLLEHPAQEGSMLYKQNRS